VKSLLDDVNELLKLNYGNSIRLEHIKETLELGKILYISDRTYAEKLVEEHLEYHSGKRFQKNNSYDYPEYSNRLKDTISKKESFSSSIDTPKTEKIKSSTESIKSSTESIGTVYCWKCGTKNPGYAKFCANCGSIIHDVKSTSELVVTKETPKIKKNEGIRISKKILLGFAILFVVIGGIVIVGSSITSVDSNDSETSFDIPENTQSLIIEESKKTGESNSKCGVGTVFDEITNSCILEESKKTGESNSKCGVGTVFDEITNSCILG